MSEVLQTVKHLFGKYEEISVKQIRNANLAPERGDSSRHPAAEGSTSAKSSGVLGEIVNLLPEDKYCLDNTQRLNFSLRDSLN